MKKKKKNSISICVFLYGIIFIFLFFLLSHLIINDSIHQLSITIKEIFMALIIEEKMNLRDIKYK